MKKRVFISLFTLLFISSLAHENEQKSSEDNIQEEIPSIAINFIVNNSQSGDQINTNLSANEQKVTAKEQAKEEVKKNTNKMPMGILYLLSAILGSTIGGSGSSNSNSATFSIFKK